MSAQIDLQQILKRYADGASALQPINLEIEASARIGLLGETGSGKSTLLRIIAGLEQPDSGVISFEGSKIQGPNDKLIPGHEDVIYLSQFFDLPRFITVEQFLDNPYHISDEEAQKINETCQVKELLKRDTRELSGGEKQRVSIAKALTQTPKVLLLDEPFSNLDFIHKIAIKEVINNIGSEFETTMLLVSHDSQDLLPWADTILVMKEGKIVQKGNPKDLYYQPISEYVARLFGETNFLSTDLFKQGPASSRAIVDGKMLIRPEEFFLSNKPLPEGVTGTIIKCSFMGDYYQFWIKVESESLIAKSHHNELKIGDEVYLTI